MSSSHLKLIWLSYPRALLETLELWFKLPVRVTEGQGKDQVSIHTSADEFCIIKWYISMRRVFIHERKRYGLNCYVRNCRKEEGQIKYWNFTFNFSMTKLSTCLSIFSCFYLWLYWYMCKKKKSLTTKIAISFSRNLHCIQVLKKTCFFLRCLVKTRADGVSESMINYVEMLCDKRRGRLDVNDIGIKAFIHWNGLPIHLA